MFVLVSAGAITVFRQKVERGHVGEFCESVLVLASWLFWAYYFSTSCGFYSGLWHLGLFKLEPCFYSQGTGKFD